MKSNYYINKIGVLCCDFNWNGLIETCEVVGCINETWFKHEEIL